MAMEDGFGISLDFELESFESVNQKMLPLLKKLQQNGKVNLDLNLANASNVESAIEKLRGEFDKLSNTQIRIFEEGNWTTISTYKNALGELLKITEKFSAEGKPLGVTGATLSGSTELENQTKLYKILLDLQKEEFRLKKQQIGASGNTAEELQRQLNVAQKMQDLTQESINKAGLNVRNSDLDRNVNIEREKLLNDYNLKLTKYQQEALDLYNRTEEAKTRKTQEEIQKQEALEQKRNQAEDNKWQKLLSDKEAKDSKAEEKQIQDEINMYEQYTEALKKVNAQKLQMTQSVNVAKGDTEKGEGILKTSTFTDLQKRIDKINVNTPKEQIDLLQSAINNLGKSQSRVIDLQKAIDNTKATIAELKANSGDFLNTEKNKTELASLEAKLQDANKLMSSLKNNSQSITNVKYNSVLDGLRTSTSSLKTNVTGEQKSSSEYQEEIKKIQELISVKMRLLEINKSQMTRQFGKEFDTSQIDSYIQKLKELSERATNMDGIKIGDVRSQITDINTGLKELSEEGRNSEGIFSKFGSTMRQFGIYIDLGDIVRQLGQAFREASEYIQTMDKAMTNIQMITGDTKTQVQSTVEQFKELGAQMHTTNTEMMKGAEENLRAGFGDEDSKYMMQSAIMGSKISGQDVGTTTEQLIAIKNAFDMTGQSMQGVVDILSKADNTSATSFSELAEAIKRTAFSAREAGTPLENLVSYITTVSEKTRKPAETIGEAFKTIYARYSNIKLGNLDDEGKSINDTEKAMKRIGIQIRDGKDQFRQFDVVLKEFLDKYKAGQLSQIDFLAGAQALAGTRQREVLLSLAMNMDDLKKHQDDLATSAGSAKKMFDEAYSTSLEAKINDLKRAFEGFYEKILSSDALKGLVTGLTKVIEIFGNLPTIVGLATTAFMAFKGQAILGAVTSLIAYQKALGASSTMSALLAGGISQISMAFRALTMAMMSNPLLLVATGATALIMAFKGIDSAIENSKKELADYNQKTSESFQTSNQEIASAQGLLEQKVSLEDQISKTHAGTEENVKLKEQLLSVEQQLAQALPNSATGYDAEGKLISENTDLIKAQIDAKKEQTKQDALDMLSKNENIKALVMQAEAYEENINKMKLAQANGEKRSSTEVYNDVTGNTYEGNAEVSDKQISNWNKKLQESKTTISQIRLAILQLRQSGVADADMGINIDPKEVLAYGNALKDTKNASDENANSQNNMQKALEGTQNGLDNVKSKAESTTSSIKELSNAFKNTSSTATLLEKALQEYQKFGKLDESTMQSIFDSGDTELISLLSNSNTFMEKGNALLKEKKDLQAQQRDEILKTAMAENQKAQATTKMVNDMAQLTGQSNEQMKELYGVDVNNKATSEAQKTAITDRVLADMAQRTGKTIDELSAQYGIDTQNKANSEQQKSNIVMQMLNDLAQKSGKTVEELAKQYGIDLQNKTNSENSKGSVVTQLLNGLASATGQTVNTLASQYGVDAQNFANAQQSKIKSYNEFASAMQTTAIGISSPDAKGIFNENGIADPFSTWEAGKSLGNMQGAYDQYKAKMQAEEQARAKAIQSQYRPVDASVGSSYSAVSAGYSPVSVGNVSGAGSPSSGKSGSGSKAKEKEVADLESLVDRYYRYKNVIDLVTNSISDYETAMKNAHGTQYVDLINKEIQAYKDKQNAIKANISEMEKERWELRVKLANSGFDFDANWNINGNYASRLEQLRNQANSLSGDAKENAIKNVKDLSDATKRYADLTFSELPKANNEWNELSNTIHDTYQKMADLVANQEKEIYSVVEYYAKKKTQTVVDGIDKEIEAINKAYDAQKQDSDIKDKQNKLYELEAEMKKYEYSLDAKSQNKFKLLKDQYEEALKDLDNTIQENQKNAVVDSLEQRKTDLQKSLEDYLDPQNVNKVIEQALKTGFINIGNETVSLTSTMKDMFASQEVGYQNVINKQDEFLKNLTTEAELYKQIDSINSNLGRNFNSVRDSSAIKGLDTVSTKDIPTNQYNTIGDTIITIDVAGNADTNTVKELSKMMDDKIKAYNKILTGKI